MVAQADFARTIHGNETILLKGNRMFNIDALVAGVGIWGCTIARRLAEAGKRVLVLEKRPVVGGNVRCEIDPVTGIEIHTYGSHIFHTQIPEVWAWVNRFVSFNGYQHKVLARTRQSPSLELKLKNGGIYFLPFGLALVNQFFGKNLTPDELQGFLDQKANTHSPTPTSNSNLTNRDVLFEVFIKNYTSKQWNKPPEEIDPSIIKRVPLRNSYDVNYFNDYWQGIPTEGYNARFERMLDHANITVRVSSSLKLKSKNGGYEFYVFDEQKKEEIPLFNFNSQLQLYYSGPIDALFNYKHGALPWRTLRFETERVSVADAQGTSVMNYVDADVPFTRQHEFKHYHPEPIGPLSQAESIKSGKETILMREYSATWKLGDEPYYPVNNDESAALLAKYEKEVEILNSTLNTHTSKLIIGGRLGQYKYFDMDKSIAAALSLV